MSDRVQPLQPRDPRLLSAEELPAALLAESSSAERYGELRRAGRRQQAGFGSPGAAPDEGAQGERSDLVEG